MIQPIRPQDASSVYRRQVGHADPAGAGTTARRTDGGGRRTDRVTLSEGAREFARVMESVAKAPDVRADRVAQLRRQVESGTYVVDPTGLAGLLASRGLDA